MELNIGSNIIKNTNGVLSVEGEKQIYLEIGEKDKQLLLTMDIFDSKGEHIAKLRRNAWVFNNKNRFEITTNPKSLKLIDKKTNLVVVEINVVGKNKVEILHGKFYTHKGNLLEITPNYWRINKSIKMSNNVFDNSGTAVSIK